MVDWRRRQIRLRFGFYPGADSDFTLYEDENDNYDYAKGQHATIKLHWDDAAKTLTFGAREGSYPGMTETHTFNVVVVGEGRGVGIGESTAQARGLLSTRAIGWC